MAILFPSTPSDGQVFVDGNGKSWTYSGTIGAWRVTPTSILANTSNGQILFNSNNTIFSSSGMSFDAASNTARFNSINVINVLTASGVNVAPTILAAFNQANTANAVAVYAADFANTINVIAVNAFNTANAANSTANSANAVRYNVTGTFIERQVFTSNNAANTAAFNITPRPYNPSNLSEGDIWINSVAARIYSRVGGGTRELMILDASQSVTGKKIFVASATTAAISVQPVAGNPSGAINGDIWYNSSNDKLSLRTNNRNLIFATNTDVEFAVGRTSNTEVFFNDNGVANGSGFLTYNKGTGTLSVGNLTVIGTATINMNSLIVGSSEINSFNILTSTSSDQILDSFANSYRSAVYTITMNTSTDYQISQINLIHNDNDSYLTEFGVIAVPNTLATFSTTYVSGTVRLNVTPAFTNTTFKIIKTSTVR